MSEVRDLTVKIKGDTSDFERSMDRTSSASDRGHASFLKLSGAVAAGQAIFSVASAGIDKLGGFLKDSVSAYQESETAVTQLNAVLKSTAGVAGVTADAAIKLSKSFQLSTAYSDEQVLSVENMALTFTSIHKDIFPQVTQAALDMAVALNHGLTPSGDEATQRMVLLGKALQDPDAGLGALKKVGVNVDELKKKFVGISDITKKQKLILQELSTEYGGSAAAATDTYAGSIQMLKNSFNDIQESIGKTILDALNPFISKAAEFANKVDWQKVIDKTVLSIKSFWKELVTLYEKAKKIYDVIEDYLEPKFIALWHTLEQKLLPQLEKLWHNVIEPLIPVLGTMLVAAIGFTVDALNFLIDATVKIIGWFEKHKAITVILAAAFGTLAASMALGAAFDALTVGFATMTLVTIPGAIASLGALAAAFVAAIPVAAVLVGIGIIAAELYVLLGMFKKLDTYKQNIAKDDEANKKMLSQAQAQATLGATPEIRARAAKQVQALHSQGYAEGGYTGSGATNEIAGVVHKGEYVLPKSEVNQTTGTPKGMGDVHITVNMGMYAGMPVEKRQIALELYKELVRAARAQGVQMPMIGAVGVQ